MPQLAINPQKMPYPSVIATSFKLRLAAHHLPLLHTSAQRLAYGHGTNKSYRAGNKWSGE